MNELIEKVLANKTEAIMDYGTFGDTLAFGGFMVLLGMATIFGVLVTLWAFLVLFKKVFHDLPEARAKNEAATPAVVEAAPAAPATVNTDEELIAVIAAAIATAESESQGLKFRVVSFKKV